MIICVYKGFYGGLGVLASVIGFGYVPSAESRLTPFPFRANS